MLSIIASSPLGRSKPKGSTCLSTRKEFSEGYYFELHLLLIFIFIFIFIYLFIIIIIIFLYVTTITLVSVNQSEPNFHTWLLTAITWPSSKMGIEGHM